MLQTLPISRLAHQIDHYLPHNRGREVTTSTAGGAIVGGLLGSILGGDNR
jgi:uncharacterized protein YcfJ